MRKAPEEDEDEHGFPVKLRTNLSDPEERWGLVWGAQIQILGRWQSVDYTLV